MSSGEELAMERGPEEDFPRDAERSKSGEGEMLRRAFVNDMGVARRRPDVVRVLFAGLQSFSGRLFSANAPKCQCGVPRKREKKFCSETRQFRHRFSG